MTEAEELELLELEEEEAKLAGPKAKHSAGLSWLFGMADPINTLDESQGLKGTVLKQAMKTLGNPGRVLEPGAVLKDAAQDYRGERDHWRQESAKADPSWKLGGQVTSSLAMPVPAAAMSTAGRAAATGATLGAASGAGGSEADLVKLIDGAPGEGVAELKKYLIDTVIGGGLGLLGGVTGRAIASGVGKVASGVRNRAQRGIQDAVEAETNTQTQLAEKSIRGGVGEYRSAIQSASRDLEVLERSAQGKGEVAETARKFLASEEANALRESIALSKLETAPERIAEMNAKRAALQGLTSGKEAAIKAQTGEALSEPWSKHIRPRLLTVSHRVVPPILGTVGATVGGVLGGVEGAIGGSVAGSVAGGVLSLTQGAYGRILKNLAAKPAARKVAWEKVLAAAGGPSPKSSAIIGALEAAAAKGEQAFATTAYELAQQFPEVADILDALKAETQPKDKAKALADSLKDFP